MTRLQFDPHSERIETAHRRLAAAYTRRPGAEVPVVEPNVFSSGISVKERFESLDNMLEHAVGWANALAATDNDWPPVLNTYCTVPMVPEAFGCRVLFREGHDATALPVLEDISDVWSLKPRRPEETPTIRRRSEWIEYAQRELGTEVPFWTADIQSPFSAAAQIVQPVELLAACISAPKAVHHLCRMVTDLSIEMMQKHIAQMEHPGFPGANFPSISANIGICIADDTPLIMLSPDMYREFAFPYNAELGEVFGGIHIHSCGDYRHNLDNLLDLPNIRSIQLHAGPGEFPLPETADEDEPFNRARRKVAYFVDTNEVARGDAYKGHNREHYAEYVLPRLRAGDLTGCILQSCGTGQGLPDADAALSWTRRQLGEF